MLTVWWRLKGAEMSDDSPIIPMACLFCPKASGCGTCVTKLLEDQRKKCWGANLLRLLSQNEGRTQAQLALALGTTQSQVSKLQQGEVSFSFLVKLKDRMGIGWEDLPPYPDITVTHAQLLNVVNAIGRQEGCGKPIGGFELEILTRLAATRFIFLLDDKASALRHARCVLDELKVGSRYGPNDIWSLWCDWGEIVCMTLAAISNYTNQHRESLAPKVGEESRGVG